MPTFLGYNNGNLNYRWEPNQWTKLGVYKRALSAQDGTDVYYIIMEGFDRILCANTIGNDITINTVNKIPLFFIKYILI